jgi:O-antigen ligase
MRITIYPWDIKSWRAAFRASGLPGVALFLLVLAAMLQTAGVSGGGVAGHSSSMTLILIRTPAAMLALLLLLFRPRIASLRITDLRFAYAAFACLYFVSALWSQERIQTIGKSTELVLAGLIFLEVSRDEHPILRVEALRQIVLLTMSAIATITVLGFVLRISTFVQPRPGIIASTTAQAPFLSGNGLGYVASALILVIFAEWQAHTLPGKAALGQLAFATALFSTAASRTSFGILLLTILLVIFKRSKVFGTLAASAVVIGAFLFWSDILDFLQRQQAHSGNMDTLSGRTVVWTAAFRLFEEHPLLGVGGGIGGKVVVSHISNIYISVMSSLHNGFFETLTGLGLVGFLIGSSMMLLTTWRALGAWNSNPEFAGTYVLIIHVWLTTTMSTGVLGWMGYEVALFLCIITNIDLVRERAQAHARVQIAPVRWSASSMIPRNQAAG